MKSLLNILFFILPVSITFGQNAATDFQSDPRLVMEEIFKAAKNKDFSKLSQLCPPDGSNDGDTKFICNIAASSEKSQKEFIAYFKDAHITGDIVYSQSQDGKEIAKVPFWFNHPSGESRSNEEMNLVKIDGKWYLLSF